MWAREPHQHRGARGHGRADRRAGEGGAAAREISEPRSLCILAVDDEAVILDLIVDAFGRTAATRSTRRRRARALQKLERRSYDILLLDLKMPEMDGQQLFHEIRRRWPDLARRVIFASGDTLHPTRGISSIRPLSLRRQAVQAGTPGGRHERDRGGADPIAATSAGD